MKKYDYIIAGGGAAGLSLAYYMSISALKNKRVLIIDKDRKNKNDRTWGFWHNQETAFDEIVKLRFNSLYFNSKYFQKKIPMGDYHYSVIRGIDFYNYVKTHLEKYPGFEFLNASISGFNHENEKVEVATDQGTFEAGFVFSSIYDEKEILKAISSDLYLRQHFKGWVIETSAPTFDPDAFTMFDFRTPQEGLMRFFYIIPHSKTRALVEYTLFSEHLLDKDAYDSAIREYIQKILKLAEFKVVEEEFGVIPMTTYRFPASQGKQIINIGSLGGSSKPSSGYTFMRIQNHVLKIVKALERDESPIIPGVSLPRYRFYDAVLLNILKTRGGLAEKLFSYMFQNNSIRQLFRFLDEEGGLTNDMKIITSLPPGPFIKSTAQLLQR